MKGLITKFLALRKRGSNTEALVLICVTVVVAIVIAVIVIIIVQFCGDYGYARYLKKCTRSCARRQPINQPR